MKWYYCHRSHSKNVNSQLPCVAAAGDGSNFVRISYWVFVILAPGHQGSHLKCMLFSGGYLFCEFPFCVLLRLSARVFVSGAGFWTGWTCLLCEVGIKFNHCVILAHNENIWLYLSIYQVINILGYVFCNFLSWVLIVLDLKFVLVCRYPRDMNFGI